MTATTSNIILIGMPGSGKSTVGVLLAKRLGKAFVDTDLLIQTGTGRTLQDIVDADGYLELRRIEEQVLLDLECRGMVIATGGSAVYSGRAMAHLRKDGTVVFLEAGLGTLRKRITDYETRGLAKRPDQSLDDLFEERCALYRKYADLMIDADVTGQDEVCEKVLAALMGRGKGTT
jgi:shikimate kinase